MRLTLKAVNAELSRLGHTARLAWRVQYVEQLRVALLKSHLALQRTTHCPDAGRSSPARRGRDKNSRAGRPFSGHTRHRPDDSEFGVRVRGGPCASGCGNGPSTSDTPNKSCHGFRRRGRSSSRPRSEAVGATPALVALDCSIQGRQAYMDVAPKGYRDAGPVRDCEAPDRRIRSVLRIGRTLRNAALSL